jgi:hypothetical protein
MTTAVKNSQLEHHNFLACPSKDASGPMTVLHGATVCSRPSPFFRASWLLLVIGSDGSWDLPLLEIWSSLTFAVFSQLFCLKPKQNSLLSPNSLQPDLLLPALSLFNKHIPFTRLYSFTLETSLLDSL